MRKILASILALACARAELISVELQEERARAAQKLVLVALAALFVAMGMLLAAFMVVVLLWDTHRMLAAGGVTLLYFSIGACALMRLQNLNRNSPPPFAATLREFASDLRLLRGSHE